MDIDCSFIHNCHHGGAITCLLVGEQNNKLWYIQTTEHYSVIKISQLPKVMKTHGWNLNAYYYVKTASLKCLHILCYILCDSGRGKATETLKRLWLPGVGRKGEWTEHPGLLRSWQHSVLYNLMEVRRSLHFCQPTEYTPLRVNPKISYGFCVIIICPYRFILSENVPSW